MAKAARQRKPLAGRVAVVAGATRGCGRGIARGLGESGAVVYGTGRSTAGQPSPYGRPETIEETASLVEAAGGTGVAVRVDHGDEAQVEALFARVVEERGRVDVLVNSVAGEDPTFRWNDPFWDTDLENVMEFQIWLELAFANLLENAERATPAEMPIEVSLCHEGSRCTVLVLDQGQALSPDVYPYLWTIHTKGPPPGVTIAGSGIGLSLCKALVEAMGGVVWAGPRLGSGSAFAVSLPLLLDPVASELAA